MNQTKKVVLLSALALTALAAVVTLAHPPVAHLAMILRWAAIAAFTAYAILHRSLTTWIFVAMLAGAELGHDAPATAINLRVLSVIFLRLIKTIIAPLLFSTLVAGIAGHADLKKVGRMGIKAIVYFEVVTTLALIIGLTAINVSKAGVGVVLPTAAATEQLAAPQKITASGTLLHAFPENIAKAIAEGEVLQIVVFSIFFGIALALVSEQRRKPLMNVIESLVEVMFKFTNIVMLFAPIGAGAAIAYTVASSGFGVLGNLAKLLATLYVALIAFVTLVLLPIALVARVPIRRFIAAVAEPFTIAFATANSEAALPRAMEEMEAFGVPRQVVAFVMPTGYSFNLDGSTLYLSLAAIFVAQCAGRHMTIGEQITLMITLMLTSKGVAGVSRASLVVLLGTATAFNLPVEPIFLILGIDQLMDMARTSVNVLGNCLATVVIAKWEGDFGTEVPSPVVLEAARQ